MSTQQISIEDKHLIRWTGLCETSGMFCIVGSNVGACQTIYVGSLGNFGEHSQAPALQNMPRVYHDLSLPQSVYYCGIIKNL